MGRLADRLIAGQAGCRRSLDGRRLLHFGEDALGVFDAVSGQSSSIAGTGDTDTVEWDHARWARDGSFIVLWRDEHRVFDGLTMRS